jgi:hypothetical protein
LRRCLSQDEHTTQPRVWNRNPGRTIVPVLRFESAPRFTRDSCCWIEEHRGPFS